MKNLRTFAIIDYVKERKYCSVSELMDHFGVSVATIHRDISNLVAKGLIQKVHGGVAANSAPENPVRLLSSPYQERIEKDRAAKEQLAELAMREIHDGDIIFLDSSTTVYFLAEKLRQSSFSSLTVITNAALIIQNFHAFPAHYVLIALGGTYDSQLNSFLGQAALSALENLSVSCAFLSAFGISRDSVTTNHEFHSQFLAGVLRKSSRSILLADSSKFTRSGLFRFASPRNFAKILTVANTVKP